MLDRRIKYYGIQGGAAALSGLILLVALLSSSGWALWCLALPLCVGIGGGGWWLSRRFGAETSRHLTPQEWAELRGALEDLPVLSVLHLFGQDRTRLERFRYLPLLKQSLWEALAEDQVDVGRVVRIAFLLHAFRQDLREYSEVIPAVPDPIVQAWMMDLVAEPGRLTRRQHLQGQAHHIPRLVEELGTGYPGIDEPKDDPGHNAAWRLLLFGPLATTQVHRALSHEDPRVREGALAVMALQEPWGTRRADLLHMLQRDEDPTLRRAALELLALEGRAALDIVRACQNDRDLGERARELARELG